MKELTQKQMAATQDRNEADRDTPPPPPPTDEEMESSSSPSKGGEDDQGSAIANQGDNAVAAEESGSDPSSDQELMTVLWLDPCDVVADPKVQLRTCMKQEAIDSYADVMREAAEEDNQFPPIVVFDVGGGRRVIVDGYHRHAAALQAGVRIRAEVRIGDIRDAILFAAQANTKHGVRLNNADKRKAVLTLLRDEEWRSWSNAEIARRCGVSHTLVKNLWDDCSKSDPEKFPPDSRRTRMAVRAGRTMNQPGYKSGSKNILEPNSDSTKSSDSESCRPATKVDSDSLASDVNDSGRDDDDATDELEAGIKGEANLIGKPEPEPEDEPEDESEAEVDAEVDADADALSEEEVVEFLRRLHALLSEAHEYLMLARELSLIKWDLKRNYFLGHFRLSWERDEAPILFDL